ncbi:MAG: hypothetical protein JKY56_14305 [Kofleriaceae bacterium]|nr:hypothetical protein [Kofleriaceae bacterium]
MAIVTAVAFSGCDPGENELGVTTEELELPISSLDIENAIASRERGEKTADVMASGELESPLFKLRQSPRATVSAWREVLDQPAVKFSKRGQLFGLLQDLCLVEASDALIDLALRPLPASSAAPSHHALGPRMLADQDRNYVFTTLGKLSGSSCDSLAGQATAGAAKARAQLVRWVQSDSQPRRIRWRAGEALLVNHPSKAAQLRSQMPADLEWMLTPFEERRVEMEVEDTPPDSHPTDSYQPVQNSAGQLSGSDTQEGSPISLARVVGDDSGIGLAPESDNSVQSLPDACAIAVNFGWDSLGDTYVSDWISFFAAWGGETCEDLKVRYYWDVIQDPVTWDEGFGILTACDDRKPYKRTVNSLFLLEHSSSTGVPSGDYSGGVIHWAYDYIKNVTPEYETTCYQGDDWVARYQNGGWWWWPQDERIQLTLGLWDFAVSIRSGIILHEARHADGYSHNVANSSCPAGGSCDSHYGYHGANTLQIQWYAQYYRSGIFADTYLRGQALQAANFYLRMNYAECPDVQLDSNGLFYGTPGICGA